jgi:hypothetical protein
MIGAEGVLAEADDDQEREGRDRLLCAKRSVAFVVALLVLVLGRNNMTFLADLTTVLVQGGAIYAFFVEPDLVAKLVLRVMDFIDARRERRAREKAERLARRAAEQQQRKLN